MKQRTDSTWIVGIIIVLSLILITILRSGYAMDPPVVEDPPVQIPELPVGKYPWTPGTDERVIPPAELPSPQAPTPEAPKRDGVRSPVEAIGYKVVGGYKIVIQPGDTLWGLAEKHFGDPWKWPLIFKDNFKPSDPTSLIHPGNTLWIRAIVVKEVE